MSDSPADCAPEVALERPDCAAELVWEAAEPRADTPGMELPPPLSDFSADSEGLPLEEVAFSVCHPVEFFVETEYDYRDEEVIIVGCFWLV